MVLGEDFWVFWGDEGEVEEVEWVLKFQLVPISCTEFEVLITNEFVHLLLLLDLRGCSLFFRKISSMS